jgi:hypothetical protein
MKEKTKHTSGPWVTHCGFVATTDHKAICKMAYTGGVQFAAPTATLEDAANARLIAASPDMLAALRSIMAALSQPAVFPADLDLCRMNAREAIAQAEGNG